MENAENHKQASAFLYTGGRGGMLVVKAGMTNIFDKNGDVIPVTVLDLVPNHVTQVKPADSKGNVGIQVGILEKKPSRATKAAIGHAKKAGVPLCSIYREMRVPAAQAAGVAPGQVLSGDFFKAGDLVDVAGISKGKGFQGVMKRYNFAGGYKTHGASLVHRSLGSIGNRADPGRVFKGKKMGGHMGHRKVTLQNLEIVRVDGKNGLILVRGNVPGPKSGVVELRKAVKKQNAKA